MEKQTDDGTKVKDKDVIETAASAMDALKTAVVRLHRTLEEMRALGDFDAQDLAVAQTAYTQRLQQFFTMHGQIAGLLKLYRHDVAALEARVQRKIDALGDIDARLGTISEDVQLRTHFATRVATYMKLMQQLKHELRCLIESRAAT